MTPSLDDLSILVSVVENRGFAAGAKFLGLPRSTVSRRIAVLEEALGVTLIRRTTRSLSLTDDGRRVYDACRAAIGAARESALGVSEHERKVSGKVAIATTSALGQFLIVPHLPALLDRYPDLQIELRLSEIRENIVAGGVDLAVRMGPLDDSSLVARHLMRVRRSLVAAPEYLARAGTPLDRADLASHKAIVTDARMDRWHFADGRVTEVRWQVAAGNMLAARELALRGVGLTWLPDFLARAAIAAGTLVAILPDDPLAQAEASIVTSPQRFRSPAVRAVIDHLVAAARTDQGGLPDG